MLTPWALLTLGCVKLRSRLNRPLIRFIPSKKYEWIKMSRLTLFDCGWFRNRWSSNGEEKIARTIGAAVARYKALLVRRRRQQTF
jgi:hypothetical protein